MSAIAAMFGSGADVPLVAQLGVDDCGWSIRRDDSQSSIVLEPAGRLCALECDEGSSLLLYEPGTDDTMGEAL